MTATIRPYEPADEEEIVRLALRAWERVYEKAGYRALPPVRFFKALQGSDGFEA